MQENNVNIQNTEVENALAPKKPINILSIIGCGLPFLSLLLFLSLIVMSNLNISTSLSLVISLVFVGGILNLAGFIISIIGLIRVKKHSGKGLTVALSIIGIIVSVVAFVLFMYLFIIFIVIQGIVNDLKNIIVFIFI